MVDLVAAIRDAPSIAVRAGSKPHGFTRVWAVVVTGRVFARSWSVAPRSWYRTLLEEPAGVVRVGRRELPFRAARVRTESLRAAVDRAYARKYARAWEARYVRDLCGPRSRATTTELILPPEVSAAGSAARARTSKGAAPPRRRTSGRTRRTKGAARRARAGGPRSA